MKAQFVDNSQHGGEKYLEVQDKAEETKLGETKNTLATENKIPANTSIQSFCSCSGSLRLPERCGFRC